MLVGALAILIACGGSASAPANGDPPPSLSVAGNWQFSMTPPPDNSFTGGIQGGFLQQDSNGSITGNVVYSIYPPGKSSPCSGGSAVVSGTFNNQGVSLNAQAGGTTFVLAGTQSSDGTTITGTYSSSGGTPASANSSACGSTQNGLAWSARLVPVLNGSVQGFFHSGTAIKDENFPLTGILFQGDNMGTTSAPVQGTLTFQNYACLGSASHQTVSVSGSISGSSVILQILADSGLVIGQIGGPQHTSNPSPVAFESVASGGYVVHGSSGYAIQSIASKNCPVGDSGNVCLALGNATDCTQPVSISPATVTFPPQFVGASPATQTITITNTDPSGSTLTGLSLGWSPLAGTNPFPGSSDFSGLPNFTEQDTCANSPGQTFSLAPQASCTVTVSFSPQQSCTWLPIANLGGVTPAHCPPFLGSNVATPPALSAKLTVNSSRSADADKTFLLPIKGVGLSALVPSTPELDFGAEALTESSPPQQVSFTNVGALPVRILPAIAPCSGQLTLPRPPQPGSVSGFQVAQGIFFQPGSTNGQNTVSYLCDLDPISNLPNFQISSDRCSGSLLAPQDSCSLTVTYAPQPTTPLLQGLDYFLELNTQQCTGGSAQPDCEIDSGRFPVELKANTISVLRMSPGAGLNFPITASGAISAPMTITLTNDKNDPLAGPVTFRGNLVQGDYIETDDCGSTLTPGASCTLTIIFTPHTTGFDPGSLTITYTAPLFIGPQTQIINLRGIGQ